MRTAKIRRVGRTPLRVRVGGISTSVWRLMRLYPSSVCRVSVARKCLDTYPRRAVIAVGRTADADMVMEAILCVRLRCARCG